MSARVVPYQCPYCGEEDLRPYEPEGDDSIRGAWHCRDCTRVFTLEYHGMAAPRTMAAPPSPSAGAARPHHPGGDRPPDPEPE